MKSNLLIMIALVALAACNKPGPAPNASAPNTASMAAEAVMPVSSWDYYSKVDDVTGKATKTAMYASNTHSFVNLVVRKSGVTTEVLVMTSKGLFSEYQLSYQDQNRISVVGIKMGGDGKPTYSRTKTKASISTNGQAIFVDDVKAFLKLLENSNTVKVRVPTGAGNYTDVGFGFPRQVDHFNSVLLEEAK